MLQNNEHRNEKRQIAWVIIYCGCIWFGIAIMIIGFISEMYFSIDCGTPCPEHCLLPIPQRRSSRA